MTLWLWIGFVAFVLFMLALDLGVFHRHAHVVTISESLAWTAFWVVLALIFNAAVYFMYQHHWLGIGLEIGHPLGGREAALQFFTGYLIEKSLSVDNIFVIAVVFSYFGVPSLYQHRVLFWGILGALVLRGIMIAAGAALIQRFDWIVYVFGGLLIVTAVKLLVTRHDTIDPGRNPLVKLARRLCPVSDRFEADRFFTTLGGRRAITPLFLVLLVVVLFAVDSIPAIFAVTRDPFLVFTSNVFAILGLRSLYFALAGVMNKFHYLQTSLVFVLAFVGIKMILSHHHPIPTYVSLAIIGAILSVGVLASILAAHRGVTPLLSPLADDLEQLATYTWKHARRVLTIVIGTSVLVVGLAMLVLPGPAIVVIPAGLAILGGEFIWARRVIRKMKRQAEKLAETVGLGGNQNKDRTDQERKP